MKVLFVNSNDQHREVYRIYLENIVQDITIEEADCIELALKKLQEIEEYEMVLCSDNIGEAAIQDLYQNIRQSSSSLHFVLFSSIHPNEISGFEGFLTGTGKNHHIKFPIVPGDFRDAILSILKPNYINNLRVAAFQKIKILHFYRFNKVLCNIYVKLSERKYVKIINSHEIYSKDRLDNFKEKGMEYFYISNHDYEKFESSFFRPGFLIMETEHMNDEEKAKTLITTHALLQEIALSLGFNQKSVELADKCISELRLLIEKEPNLMELFTKISKDQDYIYNHSYLTAITTVEILALMELDSNKTINNLCMAALMHDITLSNAKLAQISDINDPNLVNFSKDEIKEFLKHPLQVADIILESPYGNSEIVEIVRQHHENVEGTGFPCKLAPAKISLPVSIFIVAHDFVKMMYQSNFDVEMNQSFREMLVKKYKVGNFKEVASKFHQPIKKAC